MPPDEHDRDDDARAASRKLTYPVAIVLTTIWAILAIDAIATSNVEPFFIASAPFGLLCGMLFGSGIIRKDR